MMEIITFFVVYYHVFFIISAVVIGIDYLIGSEIFSELREEMDKPLYSFLIFAEFCIAISSAIGYVMNSVLILSTIWVVTVILILTVLFSIIVYAVHKFLDMEW